MGWGVMYNNTARLLYCFSKHVVLIGSFRIAESGATIAPCVLAPCWGKGEIKMMLMRGASAASDVCSAWADEFSSAPLFSAICAIARARGGCVGTVVPIIWRVLIGPQVYTDRPPEAELKRTGAVREDIGVVKTTFVGLLYVLCRSITHGCSLKNRHCLP